MKILITTDLYKPSINGVVTSVLNLSEELIKMGHDVKILTLSRTIHSHKNDNVYYIKSVPVNVYPDIRATVLLYDKLISELISWKPDVIHSQCEFFTYTYGKYISRKTKAPIVHTYHTMYEDYISYLKIDKKYSRQVVSFMSKNRLKDATVIIAPTNKVKKTLLAYDITKDIKVIPTGLNMLSFEINFEEADKEKLRKKYSIPSDGDLLLYLGRIGEEKNIKELLVYFKSLIEKRNNIYLLVVGGGPYEKKLAQEIKDLSLDSRVIMTGMVDPKLVPLFYKAADIFVSASQSETQGLTYIEALASGLPLVCKYDECLEKVLIDGYNGYFYKHEADFIKNIEEVLDNKDLKTTMKKNSLETSKYYSKTYFAKSVEKVYKLALSINKAKQRANRFNKNDLISIFKLKDHLNK